ncbi:MAG: uroporphyrinogen decarboxylase [Candidatus Hydrogenedentes bacterium]|nr:uroporphyrinogen decarboxylase [Candidatus Hydrogenedentota bacterium]
MTSKERVLAAFHHEQPDRTPCWCGSSPEFWEKAKHELVLDDEGLRVRFGDDFRRVYARHAGPEFKLMDGAAYCTVFGVQRHGIGYGHPMFNPLARADLKEIHRYPWPDPAWVDPSGIRAEAERYGKQYAILGGDWSPFWHDAIDLLGMENLIVLMFNEPEKVDAVMQHVVDYYAEANIRIFDAAGDLIDILFFGNDLGSNQGPLLGEHLFRHFVLPHMKRLIDIGHQYGVKVMMHCCGGFVPLIPAMIEAGLDGLHAVQPSCYGMDLRELKQRFGDEIVFNGCIDSHHVLIDGTPDYVRQKTREVVDIMSPGGGFIAGASHDTILGETPLANVLAMFDTIREYTARN